MDRISEFKKMMALLLALMLLVTACGRKKTPTYSFATRPAGTNTAAPPAAGQGSAKAPAGSGAGTAAAPTNAAGTDWRAEARGLSDEPVELPPWPYNSPALDFSPAEGIRITAEAGSLYDDTEITHAEMKPDGREKVYMETPDECDGFHSAICWPPEYQWEDVRVQLYRHGVSQAVREEQCPLYDRVFEGRGCPQCSRFLELGPMSPTSGRTRGSLWIGMPMRALTS